MTLALNLLIIAALIVVAPLALAMLLATSTRPGAGSRRGMCVHHALVRCGKCPVLVDARDILRALDGDA